MKRMAELIRKFFEMNDMDVLIIAFLYFATVIGLWIYTCRKWKEEENDKSDKVARIIGMADKLGVKIDTKKKEKKHDKRSDKHRISHKL